MKQNRIHITLKPLYNQCVSREIYKMYTQTGRYVAILIIIL